MSSINTVSSTNSFYQTSAPQPNQQIKTDFKTLVDALKSGDLSAAQTAFATLQKDAPNLFNSTTDQSTQSNPLSDLTTALNKGDLSGAQTAMAALQKGHHGHHHHSAESTSTTADTTATTTDTDTTSTTGTLLNVKL